MNPHRLALINAAALLSAGAMQLENKEGPPVVRPGWCACGRRISENKRQCLACKEKDNG